MAKDATGINPKLVRAIEQMLEETALDKTIDIDIRLKVLDRALNLEKLKLKMSEDEYGSGFYDDPEAKP